MNVKTLTSCFLAMEKITSQGKSAVSVEMKQVIGTLCRLLKTVGLEAVPPPETFRRAKFAGGDDVV